MQTEVHPPCSLSVREILLYVRVNKFSSSASEIIRFIPENVEISCLMLSARDLLHCLLHELCFLFQLHHLLMLEVFIIMSVFY